MVSSTCTQARRAAGLYFSKDVSDPNDDLLLQKNVFFKSGCIVNAKISQMALSAPDPAMFSAIQMLVTANQNETSQVNFAVNNRKDSRKTAEEIKTASQQSQILSTVQVVLYSIALTQMYRLMTDIIVSRVKASLITVPQNVRPLYDRNFVIKPSGDVDVIERQELIRNMMNTWPVVQNTAIGIDFLCDLLELMFPDRAAKYVQILRGVQQQQASAQQQQVNQVLQTAKQMKDGIVSLSKKPEMFSEIGRVHALPRIEMAAEQLTNMEKQINGTNNGNK